MALNISMYKIQTNIAHFAHKAKSILHVFGISLKKICSKGDTCIKNEKIEMR